MHNACERNDYRVPSLKSKLCTFKFLSEVRLQQVYVPKISEVKRCPCPDKPTEIAIRNELITLIEKNLPSLEQQQKAQFQRLLEHLRLHSADKEFLLDVLSTLTLGDHYFF